MYKIAHVVYVKNSSSNGISDVVPQYVQYQSNFLDVIMVNIADKKKFECVKNVDLVILHGMYNLSMLNFYKKNVDGKIPYIVVPHGGLNKISQGKSKIRKIIANHTLFKKYFQNAKAIQYLCEYEKNNSISIGNSKSIICRNGIVRPQRNLHVGSRDGKFHFVYIGRLNVFHKGIDVLIEAVHFLESFLREQNVCFDLIGVCRDGSDIQARKLIGKYSLHDIINFSTDGIFGDNKRNKIINSDCFIQTSRLEGLPLGILEAMSLGSPIAVTDPVGVSDVVRKYKCGDCCECSVKSVADMIKRIVEKKADLEILSDNAYKASEEFDWKSVTPNTVTSYVNIIKETNSQSR